MDFRPDPARLADPLNLFNMVYLGESGASAACFVSWNYAMQSLGAVRASVYIYLVPVITVVFSALILGEPVTVLSLLGMGAHAGWGWCCRRRRDGKRIASK